MQARPDQLGASLQRGLAPAYIVSGDEPLQVMEALDTIRAACRAQGFIERDIFDINKDFEWAHFEDTAASMSLFSDRKMIECRMPTGKPGREGSAALKKYLEDPPRDNVLIISSGKLDGGSKNSAWYKALDKVGVTVACWPIEDRELSHWLRHRFSAKGIEVDDEVVQYMRDRVEGNLLAAAQEIEKLYMLNGAGRLDIENLQTLVADNSRYSVFELVDCALKGDRARTQRIIDHLEAEGASPIVLNWAITKDIRLLAAVAGQQVSDGVLMKAGVWRNRVGLFRQALGRHRAMVFKALLARCARIDQLSKGVRIPGLSPNVWDEIGLVASRLASRTQ